MAHCCVVTAFAFIFASEILKVYTALASINPSKIIFQIHTESFSTTVKASRSAEDEFGLVNITRPTIFIIHGWVASSNTTWVLNMTNLLLKKQPCNVITVDWSAFADSLNYPMVRLQAESIGNLVGDFIIDVIRNKSEYLANVHLIGHSLGAHIAGYAGQKVYAKMQEKVARITGLDAAAPLFILSPNNQKLSRDDAHRVDGIHTNGGRAGLRYSYGTSDFFPNGGGPLQAGCPTDACSHSRSHELYIESIFSDRFIAVQCSSNSAYQSGSCNSNKKTVMGYNRSPTAFGNYYLSTKANPPYAKGYSFP